MEVVKAIPVEILSVDDLTDGEETYQFTVELMEIEKIMISVFNTQTGITFKTYIDKEGEWFKSNIYIFHADFSKALTILKDSLLNNVPILPHNEKEIKGILTIAINYEDAMYPFQLTIDIPKYVSKNGPLEDRIVSLEYQVNKLKQTPSKKKQVSDEEQVSDGEQVLEEKEIYHQKVIDYCIEKEIIKQDEETEIITITKDIFLSLFTYYTYRDKGNIPQIPDDLIQKYKIVSPPPKRIVKKKTEAKGTKEKGIKPERPKFIMYPEAPTDFKICQDIEGCMSRQVQGGHRRCMKHTEKGNALCCQCEVKYKKEGNKKLRDGWWGVIGNESNNYKGYTARHENWSEKQYFFQGEFEDNRPLWVKNKYPLE